MRGPSGAQDRGRDTPGNFGETGKSAREFIERSTLSISRSDAAFRHVHAAGRAGSVALSRGAAMQKIQITQDDNRASGQSAGKRHLRGCLPVMALGVRQSEAWQGKHQRGQQQSNLLQGILLLKPPFLTLSSPNSVKGNWAAKLASPSLLYPSHNKWLINPLNSCSPALRSRLPKPSLSIPGLWRSHFVTGWATLCAECLTHRAFFIRLRAGMSHRAHRHHYHHHGVEPCPRRPV